MSNAILARTFRFIPEGWRVWKISEALREVDRPIEMKDDELYQLVSVRRRNGGLFNREPLRGRQILTKTLRWIVPRTFLIARMQVVHGATAYVSEHFTGSAISKSYSSFEGTEICDTKYFSWLAKLPFMYSYFLDSSHGVVIEKMTFDQSRWLTLPIPLPPLAEQRRIAAILDTLDNHIQTTEQIIAKLKLTNQGLQNDLLGRGIDGDGYIRPKIRSGVQAGWRRCKLADLVSLPSGQVDPRATPYSEMVLIAPDHIESRTGKLLGRETARSQEAISGKYLFGPGDVVYSKIRPYLRKAILADEAGICSADMYPLHPTADLNSRFLLAIVLGEDFSRFAESVSMRTGIPKLNRGEFDEYSLVVPPRAEQDRIACILSSGDALLEKECEVLSKLKLQKVGLMTDLLAGRVRVPMEAA